jgi:hypothetical protein
MVSIIIPLYNEEDNVDSYEVDLFPVVDKIAETYNTAFDFIFVNDGSKDRTLEKINVIAARHKNVRVLNHEKNRGMGAALKTGFARLMPISSSPWTQISPSNPKIYRSFSRRTLVTIPNASPALRISGAGLWRR